MPDVDVGAKVDVPKPHISIKAPKFGFGLGKKKTKVKTPKADVKVEGGAGEEIDLDAGLDAHLDGKTRKGGKKFHWSPKFGLPKGGLKIGGGADGVDVSLPKPELDVSMEVPDVDVSASGPEIGVSGGAIRGGELGLTGKVCSPDVDVSVPSKKKFTFGWGSKGKKAKKVKLPTVSGDVDAGLDVGGKVDVPSVKVDVDSGDRVKGKKFHWSPNITLPKLKVHGPDVSGKLHADAPDVNVNVTGPSVKVPSVKASGHLPTVDVSVPDASLGGDLSGKLDLEGVGVGVVDADLNLPDLQISGNVSAPSVEGDLSMPDVSANLDTDVKLPSVQLTGPDLRVHGEMPDVDVGAKVDVPKPHISIKAPKFGFGLGKKKTKVKTPKADVKVEGGAGEEIDLDAGLDAHLDGKTRKGGKKFHWSPKFGLPKGGLKIGGGADGVDVSLPKPELDVSMEVPDVDVSASGPEIGVSGGAIRGGELGLTGKVCSPDVDVSVPSKKKFTFGWGSKGKKAKKVKLPTVSGDVDAGLDVGGKVDVPSVKVDVDSGDRVKGKKFHWSPNITLPKLKVHGPDVSGKLHADAPDVNVNVTGPSVKVPSVKASGHLPTVDVSVPDASLGGDLSGKLDLEGVGVGVVDADLNLPDLQISGNVSAPSVEGDLSMPDVSANLDTDVKLPSVQLTGPDLRVHGEMPDVDVGAKVDVPSVKVDVDSGDRVKGKKFHWSPNITLSKLKVHGPDVSGNLHADARNLNSNVTGTSELYNCVYSSMISSFPSSVDNSPSYILSDCCLSSEFLQSYAPASVVVVSDAGITSTMGTFSPPVFSSPTPTEPLEPVDLLPVVEEPLISPFSSPEFCDSSTLPSRILPRNAFQDIDESFSSPVDSGFNGDISNDEVEIDEIFIVPIQTNRVLPKEQYFTESQDILAAEAEEKSYHPAENLDASHGIKSDKTKLHSPFHIFKSKKHEKDSVHRVKVIDANDQISRNTEKPNVDNTHHSIPDGTGRNKVGSKSKKKVKSHHKKPRIFGGQVSTNEIISDTPMKLDHHEDYHDVIGLSFSDHNTDLTLTPRRSPSKLRDPSIRKTWHGAREPYSDFVGTLNSDQDKYTLTEDVSVSYLQPESNTKSSNNNSLNASDFLRRSIGNSTKRRPWSTLEYPPPGCHFVDDDYMFPDALTPTKIPSFRASKEIVYDVPYIDDKAIPRYEPEWPIGESRRTLISQLSQNSGSIVGMTAEEESSLISLDTKLSDHKNISKRISRFTSHLLKGNKSSLEQDDDDVSKPRSKSLTRLKTWWSKRNLPHK
ncbi:hypothetical protein Smp_038730.1 [Schistosoma mansoni]|uniref:hypothetical protein n=1 Tax=Schistosoma mansoni TaxID=6183 RepID=UPI00022DC370|nr:hypothetical protein Smp_038730.1 [Schistosoma mansoni]|eukprot:XP_018651734.1 hypothetical protein Smp_038730.1 [Schistosoma mansoni]